MDLEPKKTIRFIDSHYEDKFRIPDGGKVEVSYPDGKTAERTCKYIDAYHLYFGSNVFHICELAERMESLGATLRPVAGENEMVAVICSPHRKATLAVIDKGLEALQQCVGGYIEAVYPFKDENIALICNENGKFEGLAPCRGLTDENNQLYDVVCGQFIVCGTGAEDFTSLTAKQQDEVMKRFYLPERFTRTELGIHCEAYDDRHKASQGMHF